MSRSFRYKLACTFLAAVISIAASNGSARASVNRSDESPISEELQIPLSIWQSTDSPPKAIVLAIHGLGLHATVYDTWARHLSDEGYLVIAPDLRGYGRWWTSGKVTSASYDDSENDLRNLARTLRQKYRSLPIFIAGESLGGALAIRFAAHHADLVDGLVLSAPALKHSHHVPMRAFASSLLLLTNPVHRIDVSSYIEDCFSADGRITHEKLSDPLVKRHFKVSELLSSRHLTVSSRRCIARLPHDLPVLVLHDRDDRMIKISSVAVLQRTLLPSQIQVHISKGRGHILLETAHVQPDAINTTCEWMKLHCALRTNPSVASSNHLPDGS